MNDWNDMTARRAATTKFALLLDADPDLREACKSDGKVAKEEFRKAGDFASIPDGVRFFVVEENRESGDEIVTLVLPIQGSDIPNISPVKIWRCTYLPWVV